MAEIMHWESEALEERLRLALGIVANLDPPEDLRQAVFNNAANGLTGKTMLQPEPALLAGRFAP